MRSGYPAAWFCPTGRSTLWHHQPIPTHLGSDELQLKGSLGVIGHSSWGADRKCLVFLLYVELLKLPSFFVSRSVSVRIDDLPLLVLRKSLLSRTAGWRSGTFVVTPAWRRNYPRLDSTGCWQGVPRWVWVGRWANWLRSKLDPFHLLLKWMAVASLGTGFL